MKTPKITLIIPMYNESSIIRETAKALDEYMSKAFENYEILFSDDGSKDGCADMVRELCLPNVRVTGYAENHGKGRAVRHAVMEATGDIIMFTDADLAYGTDVIGRAYAILTDDDATDMLIGSRNLSKDGYDGYTALRKLMSKIYIRVLGFVGGFNLSDSQCGCKAFKAKAAKEIFSRVKVDGFAFDFEGILWAQNLDFKIREMPVKIINHRESTVNVFTDTLKMLRDVRRIRHRVKKEFKAEKESIG